MPKRTFRQLCSLEIADGSPTLQGSVSLEVHNAHEVIKKVEVSEFMQLHVTTLPSQQTGSDALMWVMHYNSSYSK